MQGMLSLALVLIKPALLFLAGKYRAALSQQSNRR